MKPITASKMTLLSVFVLACSNSLAGSTGGGDVVGTWQTESLNGSPLPVLLPTMNGCALTGLAGQVTVNPNGRFSGTYTYQAQCGQFSRVINRGIAGRYLVVGSDVTFAADSGFSKFSVALPVTGRVNGGSLVVQSTPVPGQTVTMTLRRR